MNEKQRNKAIRISAICKFLTTPFIAHAICVDGETQNNQIETGRKIVVPTCDVALISTIIFFKCKICLIAYDYIFPLCDSQANPETHMTQLTHDCIHHTLYYIYLQ
jgi:hypothetical protein